MPLAKKKYIERKFSKVQYAKLDDSTSGESALIFAKNWVQHCTRTHTRCPPSYPKRAPTRLLKVHNDACQLYTTQETQIGYPYYATLSHCWGKINLFKLTRDNIESLHEDIPIEKLCKTFKDALLVTRSLELEYLWIDSLCIIQDDDDDWDRESTLMAEVYGNATVNIAASQAGDGTFGLFVERTGYKVGRKYFETSGGDIYELIPKHMAETFLIVSPLSKRAWAFQERYLAQRTLHFTAEQIFAECNQHIACEAWPRGVPETWEHREFPKFPKGLHKKDWTRTVYHYLEGQLTYPKDILVALSGVARQFQERLQDQYVAGLWMKQLPWQLCWRSKLSNRYSLQSTLELPYRAPSWSWASIYGPLHGGFGRQMMSLINLTATTVL
ncbi:heterokaryon incompatibility protein-domain-containing protein [Hyaloscypha finlandica]|nr:heterokaryon incompatibility protein-domain-containing protein [Hyaloscypha finlandica]